MPRRHMSDVDGAVAIRVPPFQFDNLFIAQIAYQIEELMRDNQSRSGPCSATRLARDGAQRLLMQVIEVRMCDQNDISRRKIAQIQPRLPQPLQDEQPARKIRVDDDVQSADLQKETGMPDEGHAKLPIRNQLRLVRLAGARSDGRMPHQLCELPCSLAQRAIFQ